MWLLKIYPSDDEWRRKSFVVIGNDSLQRSVFVSSEMEINWFLSIGFSKIFSRKSTCVFIENSIWRKYLLFITPENTWQMLQTCGNIEAFYTFRTDKLHYSSIFKTCFSVSFRLYFSTALICCVHTSNDFKPKATEKWHTNYNLLHFAIMCVYWT